MKQESLGQLQTSSFSKENILCCFELDEKKEMQKTFKTGDPRNA